MSLHMIGAVDLDKFKKEVASDKVLANAQEQIAKDFVRSQAMKEGVNYGVYDPYKASGKPPSGYDTKGNPYWLSGPAVTGLAHCGSTGGSLWMLLFTFALFTAFYLAMRVMFRVIRKNW